MGRPAAHGPQVGGGGGDTRGRAAQPVSALARRDAPSPRLRPRLRRPPYGPSPGGPRNRRGGRPARRFRLPAWRRCSGAEAPGPGFIESRIARIERR